MEDQLSTSDFENVELTANLSEVESAAEQLVLPLEKQLSFSSIVDVPEAAQASTRASSQSELPAAETPATQPCVHGKQLAADNRATQPSDQLEQPAVENPAAQPSVQTKQLAADNRATQPSDQLEQPAVENPAAQPSVQTKQLAADNRATQLSVQSEQPTVETPATLPSSPASTLGLAGFARILAKIESARDQQRLAFVSHVPTGFPKLAASVAVLMALEKAGCDIIEVGIPFSDAIADGATIQGATMTALLQGASLSTAFASVKEARDAGLTAAVIFLTYWNPMLCYGIDQACQQAAACGVDGFLVVDLPIEQATIPLAALSENQLSHEEGVVVAGTAASVVPCDAVVEPPVQRSFLDFCRLYSLGFVSMMSQSTPLHRAQRIVECTNAFIYCVSFTGAAGVRNFEEWKALTLHNVKEIVTMVQTAGALQLQSGKSLPPLVVGFGIARPEQVQLLRSVEGIDGFAIGSGLIRHITSSLSPHDSRPGVKRRVTHLIRKAIPAFYTEESPKTAAKSFVAGLVASLSEFCEPLREAAHPKTSGELKPLFHHDDASQTPSATHCPPDWFFGIFGGRFVPEALMKSYDSLSDEFQAAIKDVSFLEAFASYRRQYIGGPTPVHYAKRLTEKLGGPKVYLKREDMAFTGTHKINNAIGQALLAKRLGKHRVIAETGAGQHGVAVATACALLGLECVLYVGESDAVRQAWSLLQMNVLGARVITVTSGSRTLLDAITETQRDWVVNWETTYYLIGSAVGPDPLPKIVKYFQSVLGNEARQQMLEGSPKCLPDVVVACVGGGSNAIGTFTAFIHDESVKLVGVEGGGSLGKSVEEKIGSHELSDSGTTEQTPHSPKESSTTSQAKLGSNGALESQTKTPLKGRSMTVFGPKKGSNSLEKLQKRNPTPTGPKNCATLSKGSLGVVHGTQTLLLLDNGRRTLESSSVSTGLNYPGVGPELAYLQHVGRAEFTLVSDAQAVNALTLLARTEGIITALESAHAVAWVIENAAAIGADKTVLVNISGRGEKDMEIVASALKGI